jgi:hypothetical protein
MTTILDLARRMRHRLDRLPRLPFIIAATAAALTFLGAVDWRPVAADVERQVDELAIAEELEDVGIFDGRILGGEIEILEYGFGVITDPEGEEVFSVAVHVRNPHDTASLAGSLKVEAADGDAEMTGLFELGMLEPGGEKHLTGVIPARRLDPSRLDGRELVVVADDVAQVVFLDAQTGEPTHRQRPERPSLEVVGVQALYAPEGVRVECRLESAGPDAGYWSVYVFFRDTEGRLVGGIPFDRADRYAKVTRVNDNSALLVPQGTSTRYLDLSFDEIPAEADLDRIEIGFSAR